MLLSMYLLYRLARSTKLKSYIPAIMLFILAVSTFSTLFPLSLIFIITMGAFTFLSWPTYLWYDYKGLPPGALNNILWIPHGGIRFLTIDVTYTIYHTPNTRGLENIKALSFFLFVNILGALLGYWIGKKYRIQLLSRKLWTLVGLICVALSLVPGIWFIIDYRVGISLLGFGIILWETILLSLLIDAYKRHPKKKLLDYIKEAGAYY